MSRLIEGNAIERGGRQDIERLLVLVEGQIADHLGDVNERQPGTIGMIDLHATGTAGIKPAIARDTEAIWQARPHLGEDSRINQRATSDNVERNDVMAPVGAARGLGIGDIEDAFVRRESKAIGVLDEVADHVQLAVRGIIAKDVLVTLLLGRQVALAI